VTAAEDQAAAERGRMLTQAIAEAGATMGLERAKAIALSAIEHVLDDVAETGEDYEDLATDDLVAAYVALGGSAEWYVSFLSYPTDEDFDRVPPTA